MNFFWDLFLILQAASITSDGSSSDLFARASEWEKCFIPEKLRIKGHISTINMQWKKMSWKAWEIIMIESMEHNYDNLIVSYFSVMSLVLEKNEKIAKLLVCINNIGYCTLSITIARSVSDVDASSSSYNWTWNASWIIFWNMLSIQSFLFTLSCLIHFLPCNLWYSDSHSFDSLSCCQWSTNTIKLLVFVKHDYRNFNIQRNNTSTCLGEKFGMK